MTALWDPLETSRLTADEVVLAARKREIQNILKSYVGFFDPFCELIQNSMDAVDTRMRQEGNSGFQKQLWICIDLENNSFSITDNGIGFSEAQFKTFLAPNISFKSGQNTRGKKGVGATYLAYGFNYLQLGTKTPDYNLVAEFTNGRQWVDDRENIITRPQVANSRPLQDEFNDIDRGSTFTIKFIGDNVRPKDLSWLGALNAEQWAAVLNIKTPLGHIGIGIEQQHPILCYLRVIDKNGNETKKEWFKAKYQFPHNVITGCVNLQNVLDYQQKQLDSGKDPSKIPAKFTGLNGIYNEWTTDVLAKAFEKSDEELSLITRYNISAYGYFCYSVKIWDKYNDDLVKLRRGTRILRGGLQLGTNHMPQGELITIPLKENIGYQNQSHVIVHFNDADPDLGRKGFQPELKEVAESIAVFIVNTLKRRRSLLKKDSGAAPTIIDEGNLYEWVRQQENHEEKYPLSIMNENFFIPINEISITAKPLSEQDVIVLFNQLIAGGVIRGLKLLATSQHEQYDSIFRYYVKEPLQNHVFDKISNPLGVQNMTYSTEYKSKPYVLEYKYSVDGLIRDFATEMKHERDIDLVVAWEMGEEWKSRYYVTSLLDLENIQHRPFHGITHQFMDDNSGDFRFSGIILSELIDCLQDIDTIQSEQKERYSNP